MIAPAYLIPPLACLLLRLGFDFTGGAQPYLLILLFGELTVGGLHWFFLHYQSTATEFLGSLVSSIHREDPWIELVRSTETRTDSSGRSYSVSRVRERRHSEKYYFRTTIGSEFACGKDFFLRVAQRWAIKGRRNYWSGSHIKGGRRYGLYYTDRDFTAAESSDPQRWVPVTEKHRYQNKIRRSNSIFKYEHISRARAQENGLCDYPEIEDFDAPCILSHDIPIPAGADEMFRRFNGRYASGWQMRLYIVLFEASRGAGVSELQREYWQGGHKNEFTICLGLTADDRIAWARAFSWADSQQVEVDLARWLMAQRRLNWEKIYHRLLYTLNVWQRKEFKDFDYIDVGLTPRQTLAIYLLSLLENAFALALIL